MTADRAIKEPCRVATAAAITLSGLQTIDGVALAAGDRVLVRAQSSAADNGIYEAASGAWTRASDFDGAGEAIGGTQLLVTSGTTRANSIYRIAGEGAISIGSSAIGFVALRETVTLTDYGTDVAAFRTALARIAALGGGVLVIPNGDYALASGDLSTPLAIPANTIIEGCGSRLTITGGAECYLFRATDVSNVTIRDLSARGNNEASVYNNGDFFGYYLSSGATEDAANIVVENVHLSRFKAPWWISFNNGSTNDKRLTGAHVRNSSFTSEAGGSIDPGSITWHAHAVAFDGNPGPIADCGVANLLVHARHMKGGVIFFHNVTDSRMDDVTVHEAGVEGAQDDAAAYALMTYGEGIARIAIANPILTDPRSCGLYAANGADVTVTGALVTGQTDAEIGELPKGGLVFNGTVRPRVIGGTFGGNHIDIAVNGDQEERIDGLITDVRSEGSTLASVLVSFRTPGEEENPLTFYGLEIADCALAGAGRAISVRNNAEACLNDLAIDNCEIAGETFGIRFYDLSETSAAVRNTISDCRIHVFSTGIETRGQGSLTIRNCDFYGRNGENYHLFAIDVGGLALSDLRFRDAGSGYALRTNGSTVYEQQGLQFVNCANPAFDSGSVGVSVPSHSAYLGNVVQNIAPAAGEYSGWMCMGSTTWKGVGLIES
jgi:hypothetical protein